MRLQDREVSVSAGGAAACHTTRAHGLIGLVKLIAVDHGRYGIRARTIQPAMVSKTRPADATAAYELC
ncbi:MAG: hypothetical protein GWP70_05575 [Proteobacteria bacterium]|nr:hypothetical protein [Pseudomonadota bacterium]